MAETPTVTIARRPRVRVRIKPTWSEAWLDQLDLDNDGTPESPMYLECLTVARNVAPTMSEAAFRWDAGRIKREDDTAFRDYLILDAKDWYVQVLADELDPATGEVTETRMIFVGVFPSEEVNLGDSFSGWADQDLSALGLEYLLDRAPVCQGWIVNEGPTGAEGTPNAVPVDTVPVFNERFERGVSELGNRSEAKVQRFDFEGVGTAPTAYAFSADGRPWTAWQIIEHLLLFCYDGEVPITLGGQAATALAYVPPRYDASGKTIYEVINDLADRRRGLGWCLRFAGEASPSSPITVTVHVYTLLDQDVLSDGTTVPANAEQAELVLSATDLTQEGVTFSQDTMSRYGRVVVEGENLLSMFTLSFTDGTLVKGWTDAEAADYATATGTADARRDDEFRRQNRFRSVYQAFVTPDDWDWTAGDGAGGSKHVVNPAVDESTGTIAAPDPDEDVVQGNYRRWGRQLANQLPLRNVDADTDFESEYAAPFAMMTVGENRYVMLPDGKCPGSLRMLDNRLGIEVNCTPNHLLAGSLPSGTKTTAQPVYGYTGILATVAVRTDQKLRVVADVPYVAQAGESPDQVTAKQRAMTARVKWIKVEGAELWYCVENTVVGVNSDGSLLKKSGTLAARTLRDDSEHLRLVAALAKVWYGVQRSSLTVQWARFVYDHKPGGYVTTLSDATRDEPVNSVVSSVVFDCRTARTTLRTSYAEIDADVAAGPMGRPAISTRFRGVRRGR